MVKLTQLWTLPPSLLVLIANYASLVVPQEVEVVAAHLLPRDVKYFPEHAAIERRELDIRQRLLKQPPLGMRKMSGDPGEKFYLDYWLFEDEVSRGVNESLSPFTNSFPLHGKYHNDSSIIPRYLDLRRLALFHKRDYQCPSGTSACTSIGRTDSCCAIGSTCQIIPDTGLGDVGCCPAEETCGGSVSQCGSGYSSCPGYPGGGCCVPGYACVDEGCVQVSTQVVAPPPGASTTTVTSTVTVTAPGGGLQTLTTTIIVPPIVTTPTTTTPRPRTSSSTTTRRTTSTRPTSLVCPSDFRSCPASYGGGCCHTDRACGYDRECLPLTTSNTFSPPARPTNGETTTTRSVSTLPGAGCPTGFYACSAYYEGGCCQIDRNCDKTSCPTFASTTLVNGSPTIVAPTGSGITAPGSLLTGACAPGWATCDPGVGGGCCPNNYSCGVSACTASISGDGTDVRGKIAPNTGAFSREMERVMMIFAFIFSSTALGLGILL